MSIRDVEQLKLSVRAKNALIRSGVTSIEGILGLSQDQLSAIRNIGPKTVQEVLDFQVLYEENPAAFIPKSPQNEEITAAFIPDSSRNETAAPIDPPLTMLNKAFPETIGQKILALYFTDDQGTFRTDVDVTTIKLSARALNLIKNANIDTLAELAPKE